MREGGEEREREREKEKERERVIFIAYTKVTAP